MGKSIFLFAAAMVIAAIGSWACSKNTGEVLIVASQTRTCYGVGKQRCLLVKHESSEPWSFFYSNIKGFDYEPGYEYVLKVTKEEVANPPQDASSIKYTLKEIVSRKLKTSENMPADIN